MDSNGLATNIHVLQGMTLLLPSIDAITIASFSDSLHTGESVHYTDMAYNLCLHQLIGVNSGADEVATRSEVLAGISDHHVCSLIALKGVMQGKLAARKVEPPCSILILIPKTNLCTSRMKMWGDILPGYTHLSIAPIT